MSGSSALSILSAMITPAVLISACGTLLLSTSNRVVRVIDKVHSWSDRMDALAREGVDTDESRALMQMVYSQFEATARRVKLLRMCMTAYYAAVGVFVADIVVIGTVALVAGNSTSISVGLGLFGAFLLLVGSCALIAEAQIALSSTQREMTHLRSVALRQLQAPGRTGATASRDTRSPVAVAAGAVGE